ncbi:uncharacterized protein LOC104631685 isoform X2 [Balearica regulorum gibbericeps]|uniref:uncharacterized protein LOC104631685 isoform X2 n=1 Tax=Balearica regulorum gibbericeps TaxID=100784 RepID=UPI003F623F8A
MCARPGPAPLGGRQVTCTPDTLPVGADHFWGGGAPAGSAWGRDGGRRCPRSKRAVGSGAPRHAAYFRHGTGGRTGSATMMPHAAARWGAALPSAMAGQTQEPVTFEDIAVYLSRAEWDTIAEGQRELYHSVMLDNYKLLTSLGYPGPKPDILYRMERGEEPWVCTPQSPVRWDGPDSPSLGRDRYGSWLEEHPLGWWPGAGGRSVLEERTQNPCQAGGRCMQWRLRSRRLLNKFRCLGDRSELQPEEAGRGSGTVESQDQARTVFWPGKEREAEDKQGVTANVTQHKGFPLHPVMEQQNRKADPREHLRGDHGERFQRSAPSSQCTLGELTFSQRNGELSIEELNETILKDHCYCVINETWLLRCAPRPCPLREHDYCRNRKVGVSALKDHEYCHVQRIRYQGRVNKIVRLTGKARAALHRLAKRKSQIGRIIRKAKRIVWRYNPCAHKRLEFPQGKTGCLSERVASATVPPAKAEDNPTKGMCGAFCRPAKQETLHPQPQREGSSQGRTSKALCAPVVSFEPVAAPSPSSAAVKVKREATHPKAYIHHEVHRAQLIRSPDAKQNVKGHELINSKYVSLCDEYKMVMRTVDHMLDSVCQNFELGGYSQCKDVWPIIIQIDS